jgi:hypothetical protein
LPGEEIQITVHVSNTSQTVVTGISLAAPLDPGLHLREILATHGAAEVKDGSVVIYLGSLEAGHTALVILRSRVSAQVRSGQIILSQFTAFHDDGEMRSNIVAAGLPPDVLPATGRDGRGP